MRPTFISKAPTNYYSSRRLVLWYGLIVLICLIFGARLFYLQVIKHEYYKTAALKAQLKEFEIPAERGIIEAYDGANVTPLVLNEKKFTIFADPKFITDPKSSATELTKVIGGNTAEYEAKMRLDTRYSILAKQLSRDQKEKVEHLNLLGIGTREATYRTYPQDSLASQLLGFVNDEGNGTYGIEQFLDSKLKGVPGQLKAITDASGIPLVASKNNVLIDPKPGNKVTLTIDISMQRQAEDILKAGLDAAKSKSGSVIIIDPNSGRIKAMANYPTYNPAEFQKIEDSAVFNNAAASAPLEIGSVMKPLTVAAALDKGVIKPDTTYADPGQWKIDTHTITNIEEVGGAATRSIKDILQLSLNTGAVYLLKQMGGGEINEQARLTWYDYLTNHYGFGKQTGIEQGYEAEGFVPYPKDGYGLDIQYANMSFGQGLNITPLQLAGAISSVINGGTYYKPHLIDSYSLPDGQIQKQAPEAVRTGVVKPEVSNNVRDMMQNVVEKNFQVYGFKKLPAGYKIGGKTGTAQITKQGGSYFTDRYNGMFMGYVGGAKPEYVVIVRVNEPGIAGYAGSRAAGPIFANLTQMLINNFNITPAP